MESVEMELLLICPLGFDLPPDTVAAKLCEHPLLRSAPSTIFVSSDCLAFAPAFQKLLGSELQVDYTWDDQHTETTAKPAQIDDVWYGPETNEVFRNRLWIVSSMQKTAKRVVLCGQGVISTISCMQTLSICKFQVQYLTSISLLESVSFEEVNLLLASLKPSPAAQAVASTVVQAVDTALREGKAASSSFQAQLTDLLTQQVAGVMDSLERRYSEKVAAAAQALQAKEAEYQSCIAQLNELLGTMETVQGQTLEVLKGFQQARAPAAFLPVASGGPVDPRLPRIMKDLELCETQLTVLYGDAPVPKQKKFPLTLVIEDNFCKVENRKRYALEGLELCCSVDGQAFRAVTNFTAPVGSSPHPYHVPAEPGKQLTFVIRQSGRDVCEPFGVVSGHPSTDIKSSPPVKVEPSIRDQFGLPRPPPVGPYLAKK